MFKPEPARAVPDVGRERAIEEVAVVGAAVVHLAGALACQQGESANLGTIIVYFAGSDLRHVCAACTHGQCQKSGDADLYRGSGRQVVELGGLAEAQQRGDSAPEAPLGLGRGRADFDFADAFCFLHREPPCEDRPRRAFSGLREKFGATFCQGFPY